MMSNLETWNNPLLDEHLRLTTAVVEITKLQADLKAMTNIRDAEHAAYLMQKERAEQAERERNDAIEQVRIGVLMGQKYRQELAECRRERIVDEAALRNEVIEECAKKCEGILDGWPVSNEGTLMKEMCVAAIRQMKGTT